MNYHVYAVMGDKIYPSGDFDIGEGEIPSSWRFQAEHRALLFLARNNLRGTPESGRAQWLLGDAVIEDRMGANVPSGGGDAVIRRSFANVLWNRDEQKVTPLGPGDLPTGYWNKKSGFVSMRSSWERGKNVIYVGFQSGPRLASAQNGDQNGFCIFGPSNGDVGPIAGISHRHNYRGLESSYGKCNMVFGCHGQAAEISREAGKVLVFHNNDHFGYVAGEAAPAYKSARFSIDPVKHYTRSLLFLKPDIVLVLDRVEANDDVAMRWCMCTRGPGGCPEDRKTPSPWRTWGGKGWSISWRTFLPAEQIHYYLWPFLDANGEMLFSGAQVAPAQKGKDELFLNVFVFGREPVSPLDAACERDGMNVKVTLSGKRQHSISFVADSPDKGRICIKEGGQTLYDGGMTGK